ncbi:EamA family transporter [Haloterrigena sp. SYSU A121-1]|uniref:EamA family transporter n=1 Tax=Haloterrigena gelatinilytica TaxID=2741724 RepID=A0A8J8KHN1_9EURY|nr:EamA family transporter [Haloterrigena gelatinilytica]NUB93686.1 EamA family transporter [Haloterrigena gelatinilytica]
MLLELSAVLALLASVFSGLQAVSVEYGLQNGTDTEHTSPALAATVVTIVVSVAVFWGLLLVRGVSFDGVTVGQLAPFALAGLGNPAAFRLLYFRGIDRVGARVAAAVVGANPAIAALLAVPVLGESFTVASGAGLLCIVAGGVVLQISRSTSDGGDDLLVAEFARLEARDLLVPVAAMVTLGASFVLVAIGLDGYAEPLVGTAVGQTAALAAFVALFGVSPDVRSRVRIRDRTALGAFTLAGVFVAANWLAWFSALQSGTVITVVPLSNVYPLVIVGISYAMVRQVPRSPRLLGGITVIIVGASLMQLG